MIPNRCTEVPVGVELALVGRTGTGELFSPLSLLLLPLENRLLIREPRDMANPPLRASQGGRKDGGRVEVGDLRWFSYGLFRCFCFGGG